MASMPQTEMSPDTILSDLEQYKFAQTALTYLGYSDKEPTGSMDEAWKAALRKYKSESNLPADGVLDVKTFASLAKAMVLRKMRNYAIGAGVLAAVGVGGYYAYQHYKKSSSYAELTVGSYDARISLPMYS